ncbi:MAG: hypothetical protein IPM35_10650 [Myxococcales bacterium]|nr:hypothetical protein [Myxococcales bacterium]
MTRSVFVAAMVSFVFGAGCGDEQSGVAGPDAGLAGTGAAGGSGGSGSSWPGGTGGAAQGGSSGAGGASGGSAGTTTSGGTGGGSSGSGGSGGSVSGGSGGVAPGCTPGSGGSGGPCEFPQGVPDPDFTCAATSYTDTDPSVDAAVNSVMASLTGCGVMSDCPITGYPGTNAHEICQAWFAAVTKELRAKGYCAGQHAVGDTDEIAVSNTGCAGKWYGYHICNYGGPKVVWNPGARRGWWLIKPSYCQ